ARSTALAARAIFVRAEITDGWSWNSGDESTSTSNARSAPSSQVNSSTTTRHEFIDGGHWTGKGSACLVHEANQEPIRIGPRRKGVFWGIMHLTQMGSGPILGAWRT